MKISQKINNTVVMSFRAENLIIFIKTIIGKTSVFLIHLFFGHDRIF